MNELSQIQTTIKNSLKASGVKYEQLAKKLNLSLPSVKRILNSDDISLSKLIEISRCIGVDFFELIEQAKEQTAQVYEFSLEQENTLSKDFQHFLVFRLMLMNTDLDNIQSELKINRIELNRSIKALEKCQLIELWPNDKIKILAHFPFQWIENGPLEKTYKKKIIEKVQKEMTKYGINRSTPKDSMQCAAKELFLTTEEQRSYISEMQTVFKKYSLLSSMRMKNKNSDAKTFSYLHLSGPFGWWEK